MEAIDYVRAIRAAGLTQAQVAEKTGIPQPTISKIERGEVEDVLSRNYRALARVFDELRADGRIPQADGSSSITDEAKVVHHIGAPAEQGEVAHG